VHNSPTHLYSGFIFMLSIFISVFIATSSLIVFFISYELSMFPVCLLILFYGYQPERLAALVWLILYTVVCTAPLLYFSLIQEEGLCIDFSGLSSVGYLVVSLSFMVKSPLYTLHSWLPKAHVEAPLTGSILLSGIILKLGGYGILLLSPSLENSLSLYVYLSLSGGVICSLICCRHWDIKSLVAYSSVVHMGVVTLGALSGLELGYWAACGILVGHSILSPLIFVLAWELYHFSGSRSFILCWRSPVSPSLLLMLCVCSGINYGLPPFVNFWVEVSVFQFMGSVMWLSLLPLGLSAFFGFLFSAFFYVFGAGGAKSPNVQTSEFYFLYLPPVAYSLLLPFSSSIFLF